MLLHMRVKGSFDMHPETKCSTFLLLGQRMNSCEGGIMEYLVWNIEEIWKNASQQNFKMRRQDLVMSCFIAVSVNVRRQILLGMLYPTYPGSMLIRQTFAKNDGFGAY